MAFEELLGGLREELAGLEREFRIELPKRIEHARSLGDLRESGEYEAAKDRQGFLRARIAFLQRRIAQLAGLDIRAIPRDRVGFGSIVHLSDAETGEAKAFRLVPPEEVNTSNGWVSPASPVGRALSGHREGDRVVIKTPAATRTYEVTRVITLHDQQPRDLNGGGGEGEGSGG